MPTRGGRRESFPEIQHSARRTIYESFNEVSFKQNEKLATGLTRKSHVNEVEHYVETRARPVRTVCLMLRVLPNVKVSAGAIRVDLSLSLNLGV